MDSILISESASVRDGLVLMLENILGPHGYVLGHEEVSTVLMLIEIAKRAEDREEWFPRGKWATIQSIQEKAIEQIDSLFKPAERDGVGE